MGRGSAEYRYLSVASRSILFSFGRYTLYKQDIDKVTIFCDNIIIVVSFDHRVCFFNPLSPNIRIQILQTDLYTFPL